MSEPVILTKGQNVVLSKVAPGMTKAIVGLGWDPLQGSVTADLDAMAFLLNANGRVRNDQDFVFYKNLSTANGAVKHSGDDLTGGNSEKGDDEQIQVDLSATPNDVQSIKFLVDIYQAREKNQNFGQVHNAYVRLVDAATNTEIVRYNLTEDYSGSTDIMVAELYRYNSEWKFRALGQGSSLGSAEIARNFGVNVA